MKIEELEEDMEKVTLDRAEIIDIGNIKDWEKGVRKGRVATAILQDETGTIECSLWNNQIDEFSIGDIIKIEGGFTRTFKDKLQISPGKTGKIIRINE